jgi:hypothetical protein
VHNRVGPSTNPSKCGGSRGNRMVPIHLIQLRPLPTRHLQTGFELHRHLHPQAVELYKYLEKDKYGHASFHLPSSSLGVSSLEKRCIFREASSLTSINHGSTSTISNCMLENRYRNGSRRIGPISSRFRKRRMGVHSFLPRGRGKYGNELMNSSLGTFGNASSSSEIATRDQTWERYSGAR